MSKPITAGEDASFLARPLRDTTSEQLSTMFLRGSKAPYDWMIGLELELFTFERKDHAPAAYGTMQKVLEFLAARLPKVTPEYDPTGALVGMKAGGMVISLEPGGQIELATRPYSALRPLKDEVDGYIDVLRAAGQEHGVGFWAMGYHPYRDRDSMPHMPKERYDIMREYFGRRGARALDMMHLTSSVQCAVDFSSESNMASKIRTAARVSPFLSALVAASPFAGGKLNGFKTIRYQVWLETDDDRAGIWPEMLDEEGLTFRRYVERALRLPVLFFMRDGKHRRADGKPFSYFVEHGFEGTPVTVGDLLDHLTTFFPEIRPKSYVELRGADCVPPAEAVAIAGFWRGVLEDDAVRQEIDARLGALGWADLRALQPKVARQGLEATCPIGQVGEITEWLVKLSYEWNERSTPGCADCIVPLLDRAIARRSPADDMLERAAKTSIDEAIASCEL